jgi:hypothetical protein
MTIKGFGENTVACYCVQGPRICNRGDGRKVVSCIWYRVCMHGVYDCGTPSPKALKYSTFPPHLLQPPLDIPPPIDPIRLVERHLGRPKDGAVDGFHTEHELEVDMEGVFNNAFIGWDGDGVTYRVVLVPGLVLPAPESAAHIKKRRQSELSHRRDESQPDRSPSRPNVEIVLQDRQDPTKCGVSSERRRGATRKKEPPDQPTRPSRLEPNSRTHYPCSNRLT